MTDQSAAVKAIQELVNRYKANQIEYESNEYLESQLRTDFINTLFENLGWDISNKKQKNRLEREVLVEKGDTIGRPDYSFRINGRDRFFVEIKSPSRGTERPEDILQTKSYGWNTTSVNIAVLTDFKTFKVFDTTIKPDIKQPKLGLIVECALEDYPKAAFEKIWTFSKDSVQNGSLDQLSVKDVSARRFRVPVDKALIDQMNIWRDLLAKDIYKHNSEITARELNDIVQKLLDRFIFIRLLEDRKIIDFKTLKEIVNTWKEGRHREIQAQLNLLFKQLNNDFNGEMFKEHACEQVRYDSEPIIEIIEGLYPPKSPYNFAVIGVELLGTIYEKYLGKTIRLTEKRVKIEEKPEVRKAGGVYYTPKWVVSYIVENTVGKLIDGKSPREIQNTHILDPACGSGSFLIEAVNQLFDHHLKYYEQNRKEAKLGTLDYKLAFTYDDDDKPIARLSLQTKCDIIKNSIFGVDLDPQAVEITMMSLYIKILEGERALPHNKELLPSLSENIRSGNSLIGFDYLEQQTLVNIDEKEKVNCFNWYSKKAGFGRIINETRGFDAIIGNPPYIRIQIMKEISPKQVSYLSSKYKTATTGNYDIYVVFVEKAMDLLDKNGLFGFILPNKFFKAEYGSNLRELITTNKLLHEIINFGDQQVFKEVTTYTNLLFLNKQEKTEFKYAQINRLENPTNELAIIKNNTKYQSPDLFVSPLTLEGFSKEPWQFYSNSELDLVNRLSEVHPKLSDVCDKIFQGIITGADKIFVLESMGPIDENISEFYSKALSQKVRVEKELLRPLLKGSLDIRRYRIVTPKKYVIFPYRVNGIKAELIPFNEIEKQWPQCASYLKLNKKTLEEREHGKWKNPHWYSFSRNQNLALCGTKKLLTPSIAKKSAFVYDNSGDYYFLGSGGGGGGGYGLSIAKKWNITPEYLTGLLNSKFLDYLIKKASTRFSGGFFAYNKQYIEALPIVIPRNTKENSLQERIEFLSKSILELYRNAAPKSKSSEILEREISVYEEEIDACVFTLYNLTEKDIQLVDRD